jgi:predicted kinase
VADHLVLVNGLPGSGKSTFAELLAPALNFVLIGKDALKEAMAAVAPGVPAQALGVAASGVMWELAAATAGGLVLESWWFRPRDLAFVEAGLRRSGSPATVEIWCDVPAALARERYQARRRAALYEDDRHLRESWPRWAAEAEPLRVADTIMVKTDQPVDVADVVERIRMVLARPFDGSPVPLVAGR